jgi:hypothetical protein
VTLAIYGDTPSLAWSPSGNRLAFNQAFGPYYGYGATPPPAVASSELGVFAVDPDSGDVAHLSEGPAYHPAWLDDEHVVWACSSMMVDCVDGVFKVDLGGVVEKLVPTGSQLVYSVSPVEIIYLNYDYAWLLRNLDTGRVNLVYSAAHPYYDTEPPPGFYRDQCLQNVGDVRAYAMPEDGVYVSVGGAAPVQISEDAPFFVGDPAYGVDRFNSPVPPCVSPDGSRVAFVTQHPEPGRINLHIVPVPR